MDVPWDQALDVILLTKGLGFMRVGNVLRIAPSDVLAIRQEEELRLQERRAKEKLEDLDREAAAGELRRRGRRVEDDRTAAHARSWIRQYGRPVRTPSSSRTSRR